MTDDEHTNANGGTGGSARSAEKVLGKESLRSPLPKRFYKSVTVSDEGNGFAVLLDGRGIRTPAKNKLVVPSSAMAEAIAAEWAAQGEHINPATMPVTRLVNTALDAVSEKMSEVADDIAAYAGNDLLCYRAEAPAGLVSRQAAAWDPPLAWAEKALGAKLNVQTGIMHVEQPAAALASLRAALDRFEAIELAALHIMTTLTGSAVLALAHAEEELSLEDAWAAATVDEDWQSAQWGRDTEAEARLAERLAEFTAASRCLRFRHRN